MMVIKNVLKVNVDLEVLQNHLNSLNSKQIFPNYYKLFNVAITLPINSATCERSFSAMRRLKTWMRTTMLQERFSSLGFSYSILILKKDINIDRVSVLNDFAKSNRRINLIL
uniref:HAT C-terminal dimerisation domain-containing protein n=1 Tax=Sipha flava TaxID=143950 RepID=A0A2S2R2U4_9HEMI